MRAATNIISGSGNLCFFLQRLKVIISFVGVGQMFKKIQTRDAQTNMKRDAQCSKKSFLFVSKERKPIAERLT